MSTKYFIWCFLSVLFFNYVAGHIIDSHKDEWDDIPNNEINSSDEKVSLENRLMDLEDNIIQKLEGLGRLEDLINKRNEEKPDKTNNLAAVEKIIPELEDTVKRIMVIIEKIPESLEKITQRLDALEKVKAPKLEEQVKDLKDISEKVPAALEILNPKLDALAKWSLELRTNTEKTLKVIQKIPESLEKINGRLEKLEKRQPEETLRATRSASTESNKDLSELEGMVAKLEKDFIASNKLYNENLMKTEILDLDDLDKSVLNKTGCKYLSLKESDIQVYEMNNNTMSLVTVAYQQLETFRHVRKADFETHIAIRSDGDVYILLWEDTKPVLSEPGKLHPNYEIGLGVKDSSGGIISSMKVKFDFWKGATPNILSPEEYKKFYIKAYDDSLEIGTRCDEKPLHVHETLRSGSIVAIGFLSVSKDGAKILLDCPASTCADSM